MKKAGCWVFFLLLHNSVCQGFRIRKGVLIASYGCAGAPCNTVPSISSQDAVCTYSCLDTESVTQSRAGQPVGSQQQGLGGIL